MSLLTNAFPGISDELGVYTFPSSSSSCHVFKTPSEKVTIDNIILQLENFITEDEYDETLVSSICYIFDSTPNFDKIIKQSTINIPLNNTIAVTVNNSSNNTIPEPQSSQQDNSDVMTRFNQLIASRGAEIIHEPIEHTSEDGQKEKTTIPSGTVLKALEFFKGLRELEDISLILQRAKRLTKTLQEFFDDSELLDEKFDKISSSLSTIRDTVKLMSQIDPKSKEMTSFLKFDKLEEAISQNHNRKEFSNKLKSELQSKYSAITNAATATEITCTVCLDDRIINDFKVNKNCGHMVCKDCSTSLRFCHICRANTSYITLYPN